MPGYPEFREKSVSWTWFRLGPEYDPDPARRKAFSGQQFPVHAFDDLCKQTSPRWRQSSQQTEEAYDEYVCSFPDGCVILSHSQGGRFSTAAAHSRPDFVKAHISLEPFYLSPPHKELDLSLVEHIPQLFICGDYLDADPAWIEHRDMSLAYVSALKARGADATLVELPSIGIKGNSHMIHNDRNSDDIADFIQKWMHERGLMK